MELKQYRVLDTVATSDDGRYALIEADPKTDMFDSDDGYTKEWLRRHRKMRYFGKMHAGTHTLVKPPASTADDGTTPVYDDATLSHCDSEKGAGFKWSYEHERCYCPDTRKKMLFDGTWVCFYKATGQQRTLTNAWDKPLTSVTTAHCHGDRKGYVYVKASGKCECPKSQKKFVEADKNGKAMWVCVIDSDNMLPLLAHESSKHIDKVTSKDCISARLQLKRDAAQVTCRCKVKNLVYGGSGTAVEDKIYCDLGTKTQRRVFQALRKLKQYRVLDTVATSDDGRYALIEADPKTDMFDSDDGYTKEWLRRHRKMRYFGKMHAGAHTLVKPPASTADDGTTPVYDDATLSHCDSEKGAGFKWSYEHERCYCPDTRKKMLFDGTWVCFYKATGQQRTLTNAWDKPLTSVTTAHCHGDRKGYMYVKASGKCECPKSQKKF